MRYIIILILLTSCGPAAYLKRAERSIAKAKEKGAVVKSDTTFHTFKVEGAKGEFNLGDIVLNRKDFTRDRLVLKDTVIYKDKIKIKVEKEKIQVECPDVKEKVPVVIDTKISAGYTTWDLIKLSIVVLIVGFLLGKVIKL